MVKIIIIHNLFSECSLEVKVLREECSRLERTLSDKREEANALESRLEELHSLSESLQRERNTTQHSIDTLKRIIRDISKLRRNSNSND